MTPERDKELCERYPQIFRDRDGDPKVTLMCFGFECSDGWFEIIDALCAHIQQHMNHHRAKKHMTVEEFDERVQVRAVQVKEKFGGLRFYVDNSDEYVRGLISMAEALSYRTCEVCGALGKPRSGGWVRTLCDSCSTKKEG
jgi:hypothetical protein